MTAANLKLEIQNDMKEAMRARDKERLATIRLLMAAIKQREVDERITLNDSQVLSVVEKMVRQRRESVTQFKSAGRQDLVAKEEQEIAVLQKYLPEPMSEEEESELIASAIKEVGAKELRDMGKVMAKIKSVAQGRVDMGKVGGKIKKMLNQ